MSSKPGALRTKTLWVGLAFLGVMLPIILVYSLANATKPASIPPSAGVLSAEDVSVSDPPTLSDLKRQLQLQIDGMYCPACKAAVRGKLSRLQGVSEVKVWMGGASLIYDPAIISPQRIAQSATYYVYKATIERDSLIR